MLLDECIPRKFKNALPDHECQTVLYCSHVHSIE